MRPGFTEFVRQLPGEAAGTLARAVFDQLRFLLSNELKRRGLWDSPPSYLGVPDGVRWNRGLEAQGQGSALEELTAECFAFIFVDRLQSLRAQLKIKTSLDGLIVLNVRHFLLERQRAGDPLGFKVFEMLQGAVRDALAKGELRVVAGDPQVRNETILGFDTDVEPESLAEDLAPIVARWNDSLMPELVTANGRQHVEMKARLRDLVVGLRGHGVRAFRFRDVVEPLKRDARGRWGALLPRHGGREIWEPSPKGRGPAEPVGKDQPVDQELGFRQLKRCVSATIEEIPADPRFRAYLSTLWRFLAAQAGGEDPDLGIPLLEEEDGVLSHRKLAQHLEIPRDRIPELFATLRQIVVRCQEVGPAPRGGENHDHR